MFSYTLNHTHTHTHTYTQMIHTAMPSYTDVVTSSLQNEQHHAAWKEKDQEITKLRKKFEEEMFMAKYA